MKEKSCEVEAHQSQKSNRKQTLLEKYDIPVEHIDFNYVKDCTDVPEVEKILKILRSGEEGHFPDLEAFVTKRLEELNPKSRYLRVEVPILRSDCMDKDELDELKKGFLDWVDDIEDEIEKDGRPFRSKEMSKQIFQQDFAIPDIPIRGTNNNNNNKQEESVKAKLTEMTKTKMVHDRIPEEPGFLRAPNPQRIKSWDYDKWDKFDVDKELTKLDIEAMQCEEWGKSSLNKKKLQEEQELVAKLMKNEDLQSKDSKTKKKTIFSNVQSSSSHQPHPPSTSSFAAASDQIPDLEDASPSEDLRLLQNPGEKSNGSSSRKPATINCNSTMTNSSVTPSTSTGTSRSNDAIQLENLLTSCTKKSGKSSSPAASNKFCNDPQKKSFIEELPDDKPKEEKPKRRFKIHIDDIHIA